MDAGIGDSSFRQGIHFVKNLSQLVSSKYFIWVFLAFVLVTHIPTGKGVLLSDDFVQWAALTAPESLSEKGFEIASDENGFYKRIKNTFLFMSADNGATQNLKEYGALPWWSPDDVTMHMFRPIAAITHWIDYHVLKGDVFWMQFHSLFYLLILIASYYRLCKVINCPSWVPALAIAFFAYSYSVPLNLNWVAARNAIIAPIFAIWSVLMHMRWRDTEKLSFLVMSLLALMLALLSAEAGVATLAYLGAYSLTLDRKRSLYNVWTILPALGVVVLWRLLYSSQHFGAESIDLYVDPIRSPYEFVTERLPLLPYYYMKLMLGPIAISLYVWLSTALLFVVSLGVCGLIVRGLWPYLKRNKAMQFALLGSVVAIVPFLSTNPGPRTEPFLHFGYYIILSSWIYSATRQSRLGKFPKTLMAAFIIFQLVVPFSISTVKYLRIADLETRGSDSFESVASEFDGVDKNLVVVNSPDFSNYYFRPFSWAYHNRTLPNKIQLLAPGLNDVTVERISNVRYKLTSEEGFSLIAGTPEKVDWDDDVPQVNRIKALLYRANNKIVTNNETSFTNGQKIEANGFIVTIKKTNGVLPTEMEVTFVDDEPSVWQWFDWEDRSYKRFDTLEVGESVFLPGPFDKT